MKYSDLLDDDCSIAQALAIVGDWWSLLIVRDVAGGAHRFDRLHGVLGLSRRVLAERLAKLVEHDVLDRRLYSEHPPRYEYHLTAAGHALLPVLIALQDWGARFVTGDGSLTATGSAGSSETRRVQSLVGRKLSVETLPDQHDSIINVVGDSSWTVVYCFPGAAPPGDTFYPPGWNDIPGAAGCTFEAATFRDHYDEFVAASAEVRGISTQRPDELAAFAEHADLPFTLLSDSDLDFCASLRLPTFRAGGRERSKRMTMVIDRDQVIRYVHYPVNDPAGTVLDALSWVRDAQPRST